MYSNSFHSLSEEIAIRGYVQLMVQIWKKLNSSDMISSASGIRNTSSNCKWSLLKDHESFAQFSQLHRTSMRKAAKSNAWVQVEGYLVAC